MRRIEIVIAVALAVACGPTVESTSATLDTGATEGSASGDDPCNGETPPELLAYFDAFARTEQMLAEVGADVDAVRAELAVLLGLPPEATVDEVAAALTATYAANIGPGSELVLGPVRCTGGIDGARDNLSICVPELAVESVTFTCEGECTIADALECPAPVCRGDATTCSGVCTGACESPVAAACEGICRGTCEGECDCVDEGVCAGHCAGLCTGSCEADAGPCADACSGTCDSTDADTCGGAWMCATPEVPCTLDCTGIVVPNDIAAGACDELASAAAAATMTCDPPYASLQYAAVMCSDFAETALALADAAARLERARTRVLEYGQGFGPVFDVVVEGLLEDLEIPACVAMHLFENLEHAQTVTAAAGEAGRDADDLLSALTPA
jgi:hypothetical protein